LCGLLEAANSECFQNKQTLHTAQQLKEDFLPPLGRFARNRVLIALINTSQAWLFHLGTYQ